MDSLVTFQESTRSPGPSQLTFESVWTRRTIIASYWIVILLALPLWWTTTSIERQSLPASRVFAQQGKELVFPVNVYLDAPDIDPIASSLLVQELEEALAVGFESQDSGGLRVHVSSECTTTPDIYQVRLATGTREPEVYDRSLSYDIQPEDERLTAKELSLRLSDTLATLLVPHSTLRTSQRVVKHSPRYRLAFTLLNEDATSGNAVLSWDIQNALRTHIEPVLERLSMLHNFTIESQVQFHAPLAFEPRTIHIDGHKMHALTQEDLTVFVNSAEWTLASSVSNDPVLHFIMFIPSSSHTPLQILGNDGLPVSSDAFILPQWGGIVIHNAPSAHILTRLQASSLDAVFATFRRQLTALVGVPPLPAHVHSNDTLITDWQIDALLRWRAAENAKGAQETLASIVRLVAQIKNMPVGQDVKGDVQEALAALEQAYAAAPIPPAVALGHAGKAFTLASRAFFNPGMLALLYFPAEHKYAVYTPLFASVAAPLVAAVIREFLAWRRARKAAATPKADTASKPKAE